MPYAGYGPVTILDTRGGGGTWYLRKLADDSMDFEGGAVTLPSSAISPTYWNHIIVRGFTFLIPSLAHFANPDPKRFSCADNNLH